MEPYLDVLCARDVVAVYTGAHTHSDGGYELAYLTKDVSTGRMLEVGYIRTGECGSCFKAEVLCLVRRQWDGLGLVPDQVELGTIGRPPPPHPTIRCYTVAAGGLGGPF